jgi:hypothetical protein
MQEKQVVDSQLAQQSTSLSKYALFKFILKLVKNKPKQLAAISTMWASGSTDLGPYLAKELVEVAEHLSPHLHAVANTLLLSHEGTNLDELYESIQPLLEKLLNQNLGSYGVSLNEVGLQPFFTEAYLKINVLPIFLIVRDIPKFCKSIKEKDFLQIINTLRAQVLTHFETDLHSEIRKYLLKGKDGFYEIKAEDPALVSQIKKILNALNYAEKIVTFIITLDLNPDSGFKLGPLLENKGKQHVEYMAKIIWYLAVKDSVIGNLFYFDLEQDVEPEELQFIREIEQTIQYVHKAQSSLLEIDLPTYQIFGEELKILGLIINSVQTLTTKETRVFLQDKLSRVDEAAEVVGNYVGKPLGIFIDQLSPHLGKTDYSFLTHHLGLLPGYLDQLTALIYSYGAGKPGTVPALNTKDHDAFKNAAIRLFLDLSSYEDLFFWQKAESLLFPIRKEVLTLTQGSYQQVWRVTEATGEMVAYQLSRVKNELFTKIISESDKLELYLGFAPGILTKPLMRQLTGLYQTLVSYANSVIDLKEKYPDLVQLDNTSFLTKRLQATLKEKNLCQLKLKNALKAKEDLEEFIKGADGSREKEKREALKKLYLSFKHYVIEYNPKLSVLLDEYLSTSKTAKSLGFSLKDLPALSSKIKQLCDKDAATFGCYLQLAENRLTDIPKQITGKLYPLDPKQRHSVFIVNEQDWLTEYRDLKKKGFSVGHQFHADLSALTPDNRAKLYDYHAVRVLTLKHIQREIDGFLQQLAEGDWLSDQKQINEIIERYRVLQPYLVDSLAALPDDERDKSFVGLLSQLSRDLGKPEKFVVILDAMSTGMQALKQRIVTEIERSERRQILFDFAHHQTIEAQDVLFNNAPLTLESELVKRQDKWIRHQYLSRAAADMNNALRALLGQFDPSLKLSALQSASPDVAPFPEMEGDLETLAVPSQVSWIKRMMNVVFYISSNFRYLESLDRDAHKKDVTHYFLKGPLIEGIYQIKPFLELTKAYQTLWELMLEPTGQLLFNVVSNGYNKLMQGWTTLQPLYFANADTLAVKNKAPVSSSGLWYPLLSLMVLPEHLTSLSAGTPYGASQAEKAQKEAKELAQYIEKIIAKFQGGQYFSLILQSPNLISKFLPQLKAQLDLVRGKTHDITIKHLKDIQTSLYSLLLEADALELKFGFRVGLIAEPLKLILDRFFSQFIAPLGIGLTMSTQLMLDTSSFNQRLEANRQKQAQTESLLESERTAFGRLERFLKSLELIKNKLDAKVVITEEEKKQFQEQYWELYPALQSQQSHYALAMDQRDKSVELDEFCKECLQTRVKKAEEEGQIYHYPPLKDMLYLVKHVHAAKKGNINTLEMKSGYLNAQARAINAARQQYNNKEGQEAFERFINSAIDGKIDLICKKSSQLVHLRDEFKTRLQASLLASKDELLKKINILPADDLDRTIALALEKQFQVFTQTQFMQLCQLNAIVTSIEHFQAYCHKEQLNPIYELIDPVRGTIRPKIDLLTKLKVIALDERQSPDTRLELIREEAKRDTFHTILSAHDTHFKFEAKALKRAFLNLFHSIFNFLGIATYHPEDIYVSLDKTIQEEQSTGEQSSLIKSGFFAERVTLKSKRIAVPRVEQPLKPILS